jgi:hypothetical protein
MTVDAPPQAIPARPVKDPPTGDGSSRAHAPGAVAEFFTVVYGLGWLSGAFCTRVGASH